MADEYVNSSHSLEELDKTISLVLDPNKGLEKLQSFIKGVIILTKGTNDYSELDAYNNFSDLGLYIVCRNNSDYIVGRLNIYASWGLSIVQELESFKMSGSGTSISHTTKMTRAIPFNGDSWSEWKSYQNSFIGSDKVSSTAWTEEDVAPSVKEFNNSKKFVQWSGEIIEGGLTLNSFDGENPADIVYLSNKERFAYRAEGKYYDNWNNRSRFLEDQTVKDNFFVGLDGLLYVKAETGIVVMPNTVYSVPGDITALITGNDTATITSILGDGRRFIEAVEANRLIKSKQIIIQINSFENPATDTYIIYLSFMYRKGGDFQKLTYSEMELTYRGQWSNVIRTDYKLALTEV